MSLADLVPVKPNSNLISNALEEALSVAESLGGQADPLAGASAGQSDHVLCTEEGDILCSSLLL